MHAGAAVIGETCLGCGRCVDSCPEGAINFRIDDTAFFQKTIERISSLVDVS
jgi:ferredoxin